MFESKFATGHSWEVALFLHIEGQGTELDRTHFTVKGHVERNASGPAKE